jgi:hypothetical protein
VNNLAVRQLAAFRRAIGTDTIALGGTIAMTIVNTIAPRATPRVTFSVMAELLAAPPHRVMTILKKQKYPKPGPVFGYKKATEQACAHMVNGTPLNVNAPGLRKHEVAALTSLSGNTPTLPPGFDISQASRTNRPAWQINGVEISAYPDLMLTDPTSRTGAFKFYMKRDHLDEEVGASMASLLFYYESHVLGQQSTQAAYCMVWDVRAGIPHIAGGSHRRMIGQLQNTCALVAALWPTI